MAVNGQFLQNIYRWDGTEWNSLLAGVNSTVTSLQVYEDSLYVGGYFTAANNYVAKHIARYYAPPPPCPAASAAFSFIITDSTVVYTNSSSNANAYFWNFGDGNTSIATDPVHQYGDTGIYTVQLIASNYCSSDTVTQTVSISCNLTAPSADYTYAINDSTVSFSNNSSNAATYLWDFGDGNTSTDISPVHLYNDTGTYTVQLIVFNACGSDTVSQNISISCNLPASSADFTYAINDSTVSFSNNSSNAATYLWDFGDGNTSTDINPIHLYSDTGSYAVQLISYNDCGGDTLIQTVTISCNLSAPTAEYFYSNDGTTLTFINNSVNAQFYYWDFGDGNTSTDQNPVHNYTSNGFYTIMLVVRNLCSSDTFTTSISIVGVWVNENKLKQEYLGNNIPNPFSSTTQIPYYLPENSKGIINIHSSDGKFIKSYNLQQGVNTLVLKNENLATGIYYYRLIINEGEVTVKKRMTVTKY